MSFRPLQPSNFGLPNDPAQPVVTVLSRAFLKNLMTLFEIINQAHTLGTHSEVTLDEEDAVGKLERALPFVGNLKQLLPWVHPPRKPVGFAVALNRAEALKQAGLESNDVKEVFRILQKRPVGAPPKRRQSFIAAFEFMLQSKQNSLGRAKRQFCRCGQEKHTVKCERGLKAGIHDLTKILRKYAPDLVFQYNALHPDRAKKPMARKSSRIFYP